ncbi:alpha/beta fold hydrolase [Paracidovorax sp. MALMAid1276]|uniref:alpha/beta fold hydrolase n=1 Tax=Paracidovorax sp. MALMAid1276 TaxID=3411631 RepID=UPI003B9C3839
MTFSHWRRAVFPMSLGMQAEGAGGAAAAVAPRRGEWTARDFRFHTGQTLPEVRLAYATVGDPSGEPVLVLHGTNGSADSLLTPGFAGALFGPGQALDARRYFIILPDALGAGRSSKPSDGLRTAFPRYDFDDMVAAQHRLVTEHFGLRHLRAVVGYSMGGMHTWLWAQRYPGFMDIAVPMAAQPAAMSGRNWMMRRLIIDAIRNDPDWQGGHYTRQPRSLQFASVFYNVATNGGHLGLQQLAPTRAAADALLDQRLQAPFDGDANDHLYQWEASRDYDPAPGLSQITARVLAIQSADDERNPPELGLLEQAIARIPHAQALRVPVSADTTGHATLCHARFYSERLAQLLATAPTTTA